MKSAKLSLLKGLNRNSRSGDKFELIDQNFEELNESLMKTSLTGNCLNSSLIV